MSNHNSPQGFHHGEVVQTDSTGWAALSTPVKAGVVVVGGGVGLLVVFKLLPAMVAGMGIAVVLALLFLPYWIPSIIAIVRKHPAKGGIIALNFFFGWSVLGWFFALFWALGNASRGGGATTVVVQNHIVAGNTTYGQPPAPPTGAAQVNYQTPPSVQAPPPAPAVQQAPQYKVGDIVNGHVYDGNTWQPVAK